MEYVFFFIKCSLFFDVQNNIFFLFLKEIIQFFIELLFLVKSLGILGNLQFLGLLCLDTCGFLCISGSDEVGVKNCYKIFVWKSEGWEIQKLVVGSSDKILLGSVVKIFYFDSERVF